MRSLSFLCLVACSVGVWAQGSSAQSKPSSANSQKAESSSAADSHKPNLEPPHSDRVNIQDLGPADGQSSSKDTQIDLSPPPDDSREHPDSAEILKDETSAPANGDINETHPWDPHKAAKDIEVGDFYFKRKNYRAAEDRYREALYYKDNDALATFHLAECLEKLNRPEEAKTEYQNYLKILPHGAQAEDAKKAIGRLSADASNAKAAK
jgi:tetratricopeptide (TPR) repeat protein